VKIHLFAMTAMLHVLVAVALQQRTVFLASKTLISKAMVLVSATLDCISNLISSNVSLALDSVGYVKSKLL